MQFFDAFYMSCFMYISSNAPHDSFLYPLQKQLHSVGQCIDTHGSLAIFSEAITYNIVLFVIQDEYWDIRRYRNRER